MLHPTRWIKDILSALIFARILEAKGSTTSASRRAMRCEAQVRSPYILAFPWVAVKELKLSYHNGYT